MPGYLMFHAVGLSEKMQWEDFDTKRDRIRHQKSNGLREIYLGAKI